MKRALMIVSLMFSFSSLSGAPIVWNTPVTISSAGVNATDSHIATDASGNLVAVWVENNAVKASTQPVSTGIWGTPTTLSVTATASSPRVVSDPNGNATAIWIDGGAMTAATLPFGGVWSSTATLSVTGATTPNLAVDTSGDVVAVWTLSGTIQSATQVFGGSWPIIPDTISVTGVTSDTPSVSIGGPTKVAVAVWHGFNTIDTVYAVSKNIGGSWGVVQTISPSTVSSSNPRVAVGPAGGALATFFEFALVGSQYSAVSLAASFLPPGGTWRASGTVKDTGIVNPANLCSSLVVDRSANALAVWTTSYDGANFTLNSVVLQSNGNLTSQLALDTGLYLYSQDLVVDSSGSAVLAYMNEVPESLDLVITSWEMSLDSFSPNSWNSETTISTNTIVGYPRVAATFSGGTNLTAAVWESTNGTNTTIQAVTGTGGVLGPPSNLAVVQNVNNLTIFNEYYNTLSWSASTDPEVNGYVVYRNGNIIGVMDASTLQFIDDNRNPSVPDTYGVASFGAGADQSVTMTIISP